MDKKIELTGDEVEFFKYFIKQYNAHLKVGEVEDSHHCAVAVLLEMQKIIFGVDDDQVS